MSKTTKPQHVPKRAVPENYYSANEIAAFEHILPERMRQMAEETMLKLMTVAQEEGLVDKNGAVAYAKLPKLFNTLKGGICTDKTVNAFLTNPSLAPFGHMFRLFFRRQMRAENDASPLFYGDFGVRQTVYEKYKATGKVADYAGRGALPKYDVPAREGRSKVELPDGGRIDVPMNAVYRQFRNGIRRCNAASEQKVTVPEMVIAALREFMANRKAIFGEQTVELDEQKLPNKYTKEMRVALDPETSNMVNKFIQRYNATHTPALTQTEFIRLAIRAQLERMPLALVDPQLAAQLREV